MVQITFRAKTDLCMYMYMYVHRLFVSNEVLTTKNAIRICVLFVHCTCSQKNPQNDQALHEVACKSVLQFDTLAMKKHLIG